MARCQAKGKNVRFKTPYEMLAHQYGADNLATEIIIGIGNKDHHPPEEDCYIIFKQIVSEFIRTNPNLDVISADLHMDEATPHIHIGFIPHYPKERFKIVNGQRVEKNIRAMDEGLGFDAATQYQRRLNPTGKGGKNCFLLLRESLIEISEAAMRPFGYYREVMGNKARHIAKTEDYVKALEASGSENTREQINEKQKERDRLLEEVTQDPLLKIEDQARLAEDFQSCLEEIREECLEEIDLEIKRLRVIREQENTKLNISDPEIRQEMVLEIEEFKDRLQQQARTQIELKQMELDQEISWMQREYKKVQTTDLGQLLNEHKSFIDHAGSWNRAYLNLKSIQEERLDDLQYQINYLTALKEQVEIQIEGVVKEIVDGRIDEMMTELANIRQLELQSDPDPVNELFESDYYTTELSDGTATREFKLIPADLFERARTVWHRITHLYERVFNCLERMYEKCKTLIRQLHYELKVHFNFERILMLKIGYDKPKSYSQQFERKVLDKSEEFMKDAVKSGRDIKFSEESFLSGSQNPSKGYEAYIPQPNPMPSQSDYQEYQTPVQQMSVNPRQSPEGYVDGYYPESEVQEGQFIESDSSISDYTNLPYQADEGLVNAYQPEVISNASEFFKMPEQMDVQTDPFKESPSYTREAYPQAAQMPAASKAEDKDRTRQSERTREKRNLSPVSSNRASRRKLKPLEKRGRESITLSSSEAKTEAKEFERRETPISEPAASNKEWSSEIDAGYDIGLQKEAESRSWMRLDERTNMEFQVDSPSITENSEIESAKDSVPETTLERNESDLSKPEEKEKEYDYDFDFDF